MHHKCESRLVHKYLHHLSTAAIVALREEQQYLTTVAEEIVIATLVYRQ
jgi:hypothetical protein